MRAGRTSAIMLRGVAQLLTLPFPDASPILTSAARAASWGRRCNRHVSRRLDRFPSQVKRTSRRPQFDSLTDRPLTTHTIKTVPEVCMMRPRDLDTPKKRPTCVWHHCTLSWSKYVGIAEALLQSSTYLLLGVGTLTVSVPGTAVCSRQLVLVKVSTYEHEAPTCNCVGQQWTICTRMVVGIECHKAHTKVTQGVQSGTTTPTVTP